MNSDEEDEKKLFVKFCSRAVLFSMRKATHEQKYQRKNVENIYMQKDRLRPAIGAENFIYLFETRTGSKIYNKFVANAFLPEKKKEELIRLAKPMKPVYFARRERAHPAQMQFRRN